MDNEKCEYLFVHEDTVKKVINDMPEEEKLYDLAELFKIFGDSTRIKILYALFEAELCVCDIAQLLKVSQTAVSHQLRVLKTNKLVKSRKDGKNVFYSLADDHVYSIINQGMDHPPLGPVMSRRPPAATAPPKRSAPSLPLCLCTLFQIQRKIFPLTN